MMSATCGATGTVGRDYLLNPLITAYSKNVNSGKLAFPLAKSLRPSGRPLSTVFLFSMGAGDRWRKIR